MKRLFATPKKAVITTISITAVLLAAGVLVPTAVIYNSLIDKDEAKKIALSDAAVSADDISAFRAELDFEDGHFQYDVDFYSNGVEYEYHLLAKNGEIISRDIDGNRISASTESNKEYYAFTDEDTSVNNDNSNNDSNASNNTSRNNEYSGISESEAKSVVLADAGVTEAEATFTKIHLDDDDSVLVYEIEFYTAQAEYDYEISAVDGQIRERRSEQFVSAVLTESQAKSAALADAGLSENEVTFLYAELDKEDSIHVYDIEFYTAHAEYDYEISAVDGAVRERNINVFDTSDVSVEAPGNISVDSAKQIAVEHAGLSIDQVQFSKAKLENDDGKMEYDIEFYHSNIEYEYSIDAVSGQILEYDSDYR